MAEAIGISHTSVQRIWREAGSKPHLTRPFKISIIGRCPGLSHSGQVTSAHLASRTSYEGLTAQLLFSSVLLVYFLNSASTNIGSGFPGIFVP